MAALWDLITVDGMDALAVKQACKFAKEHVLKNGPIVLIWHIRLRRMDPHHHHHLYPRTGEVRETPALHIPYRILHENLQSKITSFIFFSRAASTFRGLLASGKCSSWGMKYLKTWTRSADQKDLSDISLIENCYL